MPARHRATANTRTKLVVAMALSLALVVTLLQATGFGPFASESTQAVVAPSTISLSSDKETFLAGTTFKLTAKTDVSVQYSASVIEIVDSTTYSVLKSCASGSICFVNATFSTGDPHVYIARVASLTSEAVTVARANWEVTLTAAKPTTIAGQVSKLTAISNQNPASTGGAYSIDIFDLTSGVRLKSCVTGKVCTVNSPTFYQDDEHVHFFVAVVGAVGSPATVEESLDVQATSETVAVERAAWSIELTADRTDVAVGQIVTLTAVANQNVSLTNDKYWLYIFDLQNNKWVATCTTGTTCKGYASFISLATNGNSFEAAVAAAGAVRPASTSDLEDIQGMSNGQYVNTEPWETIVSTDRVVAAAGETITVTATTSGNVGRSEGTLSIYVFELLTRRLLKECTSGTTCTATDTFYTADDYPYVGYYYYAIIAPPGVDASHFDDFDFFHI